MGHRTAMPIVEGVGRNKFGERESSRPMEQNPRRGVTGH